MQNDRQSGSSVRSKISAASAAQLLSAVLGVALPTTFSQAAAGFSFGANQYGELGNGSTGNGSAANSANAPVQIIGMNYGVTGLAAGGAHSLAIKSGALYGWGLLVFGQTGDGTGNGSTISSNLVPQPALILTSGVTSVAAGLYFSVAVANGGVYTFGANSGGVLANGVSSYTATPTAVPSLSSGVTAISGGQQHALVIQNGRSMPSVGTTQDKLATAHPVPLPRAM